ncbi:MAG: thioredoxin domain-containing protein [Cyclobacteriaceae bacterium]
MTTSSKPNRLLHSTSPYLLQHAYNPVDWYEWGSEALEKAKKEDKPILISIGYSSCHWCHVMAHQSFENDDIAQLMNEHFVCIKLDREERPDIDQVYMEAVQAMQQNGGWPLNVFLTPDQKPFFGGTYFPPKNWAQLLLQINKAFKEKRKEIEESANDVSNHLAVSDLQRFKNQPSDGALTLTMLDKMFGVLESRFDFTFGGIDKAPKFIMPSTWLFLSRYYHVTKNEGALKMLHLTLKKIAAGGIYDQVGGGFARYSVDGEWFAPHFEKMLYDNAQLLSQYSEAYSITKDELYKSVVYETVAWLEREMTDKEGGFYSALDADSEGEEGKFYTWTYDDLKEILGKDAALAAAYYGVTKEGNWPEGHGRNILKRESENEINPEFITINEKLLAARSKRIRPGLDDKILTGWNAMTIQGLIDAYKAFGDSHFLILAEKAITFIESNLIRENKIYRSFKNTRSSTSGFLDDYAFLIKAYISLYQVTFNEKYIVEARRWCENTLAEFFDNEENYLYFNSNLAEKLIARKKEIFDNVIPSSNSVMARNLYHLGIILDKPEWQELSTEMIQRLASLIQSEPVYMCHWAVLATEMAKGLAEVVMTGKNSESLRKEFHQHYLPFALTMGTTGKSSLPLIAGRETEKETIYVCYQKACQLPVNSVEDALAEVRKLEVRG